MNFNIEKGLLDGQDDCEEWHKWDDKDDLDDWDDQNG